MKKRKTWKKAVTDKLEGKLLASASASVKSGSDLLQDAKLLLDGNRFSSSAALAVLAVEEFGKAVVLFNAAFQKRWDSALHASLTSHGEKQGVSVGFEVMLQMMESQSAQDLLGLITPNDDNLEKIHKFIEPAIDEASKAIKAKRYDKIKQMALYVSIGPEANIETQPKTAITQKIAIEVVAMAERCKSVVRYYENPTVINWAREQSRILGALQQEQGQQTNL